MLVRDLLKWLSRFSEIHKWTLHCPFDDMTKAASTYHQPSQG
jgi:hypothetical protein